MFNLGVSENSEERPLIFRFRMSIPTIPKKAAVREAWPRWGWGSHGLRERTCEDSVLRVRASG